MIKLQNNTPKVYYERSRDFQLIGRLYDVVLNSVKTNADIISYGIPYSDFSPESFLELLARTLGFKPKHNYSRNQLLAICNIFSAVVRNKGNIKAVQLIGEAILKVEGVVGNILCLMKYDAENQKDLPVLRIIVPDKLAEIALFYDLLEYVVPAGCACDIVRGEIADPILVNTGLGTEDIVKFVKRKDSESYKLLGNKIAQIKPFDSDTNITTTFPIITKVGDQETTKELQDNHINAGVVWRRGNSYKYKTK